MKKPLKMYAIGGLGADHRVFSRLGLGMELLPIIWISPFKNESISAYTKRLSTQIDKNQKIGLIGVSFGGMIAIELNRILKPEITILISSVSKSSDLPRIRSVFRSLKFVSILPGFLFKPPTLLMTYLFGAENKKLLKEIIQDTDPHFLKRALNRILFWNSNLPISSLYHIHGSKDRIMPSMPKNAIVIENGGHFMIVDKAKEISKILIEIIKNH